MRIGPWRQGLVGNATSSPTCPTGRRRRQIRTAGKIPHNEADRDTWHPPVKFLQPGMRWWYLLAPTPIPSVHTARPGRFVQVPGEFYFMALGGLGVSLAGFAGVIAALDRPSESQSPVAAWRIRNIVIGGFTLTIAGFAVIAVHAVTGGNVTLTVRIISVLLFLSHPVRMAFEARPGPAWPSEFGRRFALGTAILYMAGYAASAIRGGAGFLELMLLLELLDPLSIFFNTARDVARRRSGNVEPDGAT